MAPPRSSAEDDAAKLRSQGGAPAPARGGAFRVHGRRNVQLRAVLTHIEAGWQRQADVLNLGLGGAAIAVAADLEAGGAITLSFVAPTLWDPLVIRGRVAWSRRQSETSLHAGIAFEHKSHAAVFALFELVGAMAYE